MIPTAILRLSVYSILAFSMVYIIFFLGGPIKIELPAHIVDCKEPTISKRTMMFYKEQIPQRQSWLRKVLEGVKSDNSYMYLYNNLAPEIYCPELVRVGTTNDGGKWICSPWRIPDGCTILSLGLNNEVSFEQQLQTITKSRCRLFGFDMHLWNKQRNETINQLKEVNSTAEQAKISLSTVEEKNEYTIEDLLSARGIPQIEILKIDIEGAEHDVLIPFLQKFTVAQILIEIHKSADKMAQLLVAISKMGYHLLSYEINGKHHGLCEFSFVHETAFRRYAVEKIARYLDL